MQGLLIIEFQFIESNYAYNGSSYLVSLDYCRQKSKYMQNDPSYKSTSTNLVR